MRTDAFVTDILPPDMKVLMNHIYEYKKGVRSMVLFTFNKRYESYATSRLGARTSAIYFSLWETTE